MKEILDEFEQFFEMSESQAKASKAGAVKGTIKGRDVQLGVKVTFEESALGCDKEVTFNRNENC